MTGVEGFWSAVILSKVLDNFVIKCWQMLYERKQIDEFTCKTRQSSDRSGYTVPDFKTLQEDNESN